GAARSAVRERAAAGFHQEGVRVPMITAVELDDLIAPGERAREADTRHRRFRAAVDHSHFLDRLNPLADQSRHLHVKSILESKTQSAPRSVADRVDYDFGRVPQNRRSPTAHVVDISISIHIPDLCTFPAIGEKWFAVYVAKRAHRRIYTARNAFLCASK